MRKTFFVWLAALALLPFGGRLSGAENFEQRYAALEKSGKKQSASARLQELFRVQWDYTMHESPEFATYVGYPGLNDRWSDISLPAIQRRIKELQRPLRVLKSIDRDRLTDAEKLSYDLFRKDLELDQEAVGFQGYLLAINQMGGVQQEIAQTIEIMPRQTTADLENIRTRLAGAPRLIDQVVELLKAGLQAGITPPRITLRDVPSQIKNQMVDSTNHPFLKPFNAEPSTVSKEQRARLRQESVALMREQLFPAFQRLHDFLEKTYIPGARESIGLSALPQGPAWYAHNARRSTTTSLSPAEIHQIGLKEVARIRQEMDSAMKESGFQGSFDEFKIFLDTDPRFYYSDAESLLGGYRDICKRADAELVKLFGKLPRLPYGVVPVPSYAEKSQTTAYYQPGSLAAGRPGYFFANTFELKTRPKWAMEALSLHEAVPGHHLQIALAQELENVPDFRRHGGYTAFVEGWGLYSESLGSDMGFYTNSYSRYGQLTYEIWRAIRLVVDTGMHSMNWTRDQAIDFFKTNTSKSEAEIVVEVDRYIVWPGQALAYKIGELKIKELRARAVRELGEQFDLRAFHDELLGQGALPLDILEQRIASWIATRKKSGPPKRP